MDKADKKKLITEITVSSLVIILIALIIVLVEHCYSNIVVIQHSSTKDKVLSDILKAIAVFLGFVISSIVMRFNQLDRLIQEMARDLNTILHGNGYGNVALTQKDLTSKFETYLKTSTQKELDRKILVNYTALCSFRADHLKWLIYPLYYSLITLCLAFILLIFNDTVSKIDGFYSFTFSLCFLMAIWTIKINVDLVYSFFTNSFIKEI